MASSVRNRSSVKVQVRAKRRKRIRARVEGTSERPRLCVFRSNQYLYAQIIDDGLGQTLVSGSTLRIKADHESSPGRSIAAATALGKLIAVRAIERSIDQVVFDRSGYLYHGRIKAVADAAREGGLQF